METGAHRGRFVPMDPRRSPQGSSPGFPLQWRATAYRDPPGTVLQLTQRRQEGCTIPLHGYGIFCDGCREMDQLQIADRVRARALMRAHARYCSTGAYGMEVMGPACPRCPEVYEVAEASNRGSAPRRLA